MFVSCKWGVLVPIVDETRIVSVWNLRGHRDEVGSFWKYVVDKVVYLRIEPRYFQLYIARCG
jgi:hypothetical protein